MFEWAELGGMTEKAQEGTESIVNLIVYDVNCQNESVTECLMHCMIAGGQTQAAVSKHITVSVLLIHSIFQFHSNTLSFLFFRAEHIPFSHMGTRILNQLREGVAFPSRVLFTLSFEQYKSCVLF